MKISEINTRWEEIEQESYEDYLTLEIELYKDVLTYIKSSQMKRLSKHAFAIISRTLVPKKKKAKTFKMYPSLEHFCYDWCKRTKTGEFIIKLGAITMHLGNKFSETVQASILREEYPKMAALIQKIYIYNEIKT